MDIPHCLSIHPLVDTWVASMFWALWIMLLWTWVYNTFSRACFQFFWYMPKSGIARSFRNYILIFWGNIILFSTAAVPFYIPNKSARVPVSPHSCWRLLFSVFYLFVSNSSHPSERVKVLSHSQAQVDDVAIRGNEDHRRRNRLLTSWSWSSLWISM